MYKGVDSFKGQTTLIEEPYSNITNFRVAAGIGIFLTFIGGLIRLLTAIPGISENMDRDTQFWLCFTAQLFSGKYIFQTLQY